MVNERFVKRVEYTDDYDYAIGLAVICLMIMWITYMISDYISLVFIESSLLILIIILASIGNRRVYWEKEK